MIGWIVTACLTALAGIMYAVYIQFLSPGFSFSITQSVLYAVIPIIGGIGTIAGPVIGTLLMVPLEHISQTEFGGTYGAITYVVYGIILILLIIYAPEGLRPKLKVVADPSPTRCRRSETRRPTTTPSPTRANPATTDRGQTVSLVDVRRHPRGGLPSESRGWDIPKLTSIPVTMNPYGIR